MNKTDTVYLDDISKAITAIEKYTKNVTFDQFKKEQMRHDAVIRQLEIIGEAVNKLSSDFASKNPNFPIRQTISMRNFLIHGYDEVELDVVWKTTQENLPELKLATRAALQK